MQNEAVNFKDRKPPQALLFSDRRKVKNFAAAIENLPKNSAVIFREYDLPNQQRLKLALELQKLAKKFNQRFLVGKDLALALRIKADGVHFSDHDSLPLILKSPISRLQKLPANFLLSYGCHNLRAVFNCQRFSPNLIFLSPIFASSSHPNQQPLGIFTFRKAAFLASKLRNCLRCRFGELDLLCFRASKAKRIKTYGERGSTENTAKMAAKVRDRKQFLRAQSSCHLNFYPLGGINSANFKLLKTTTKPIISGFGAIDFFTKGIS